MVKDIIGHKMSYDMKGRKKVYVKSFPGAKIECMEDYIKPSMKHNPDIILLHVGTNDLRSIKSAEDIAKDIIKLSTKIKSKDNEVIISNIIPRNDSLNVKGLKVNTYLKELCIEKNLLYCDNSDISKSLNLNYKGTIALANNFLDYLNY